MYRLTLIIHQLTAFVTCVNKVYDLNMFLIYKTLTKCRHYRFDCFRTHCVIKSNVEKDCEPSVVAKHATTVLYVYGASSTRLLLYPVLVNVQQLDVNFCFKLSNFQYPYTVYVFLHILICYSTYIPKWYVITYYQVGNCSGVKNNIATTHQKKLDVTKNLRYTWSYMTQ